MMIAILDDEIFWREKTIEAIRTVLDDDTVIEQYDSGEKFLSENKQYDIVFYDIDMGEEKLDGFQVCCEYSKMYPDSCSIILTSYTQYARKGYVVNAFRYIDKGNMDEEIEEALTSFNKINAVKPVIEVHDVKTSITHPMYVKDIMYVETVLRKIVIHHSKYDVETNLSMNELWDMLKEYGFGIPFKSYIINFKYVDRFEKDVLYMTNQAKIPISRRKNREFMEQLIKWRNLMAT